MKKTFRWLFLFDRCVCRLWRIILWFKQRAESESNRRILLRLASCGQGVKLSGRVILHSPKKIVLGNNVHIGTNAWIQADAGLTIGDNCHISRNFTLYTANHCYAGDRLPYDEQLDLKPVVIGRNVWIGMNVCVVPGTTIGDGVIVGMGTVVSGEVPPLSIIGNQKWRILGHRDKDEYDKLERNQQYGGSGGIPFHLDS